VLGLRAREDRASLISPSRSPMRWSTPPRRAGCGSARGAGRPGHHAVPLPARSRCCCPAGGGAARGRAAAGGRPSRRARPRPRRDAPGAATRRTCTASSATSGARSARASPPRARRVAPRPSARCAPPPRRRRRRAPPVPTGQRRPTRSRRRPAGCARRGLHGSGPAPASSPWLLAGGATYPCPGHCWLSPQVSRLTVRGPCPASAIQGMIEP